jgi:hypothetical protein
LKKIKIEKRISNIKIEFNIKIESARSFTNTERMHYFNGCEEEAENENNQPTLINLLIQYNNF